MKGQTLKQSGRAQFQAACKEYHAALHAVPYDPGRFIRASLIVHRESGNPGVTKAMQAVPKRYFRQYCNQFKP